jgi:uncharacterized membrane protein
MSQRLANVEERLRSHVLFIPGLIALLGMGLAIGLVELDRAVDLYRVRAVPWIFRAGASGAREVLSTIATSMVQLAGITFSVTVVALALRSQQFGPRLIRNFTRDRMNQVVLGTFVATALYGLMVLRAVRDLDDAEAVDEETFVPLISVTGALILAIVALGMFIVFIHRVLESVQANTVIADAADETRGAIAYLFPEPLGEGLDEGVEDVPDPPEASAEVTATKTGYVQHVDGEILLTLAAEADAVVWLRAPVGGFVVDPSPIACVAGRNEEVRSETLERIRGAFQIGRNRTIVEDPEFGMQQIVDLAVKALSPSDNDPTTAVTSVDHLGALLVELARRNIPSRVRADEAGTARVYAMGPTFQSMAGIVFDGLLPHLRGQTAVILAVLRAQARVAAVLRTPSRREVLWMHARRIGRAAAREVADASDRRRIESALQAVGRALARDPAALAQARLSDE